MKHITCYFDVISPYAYLAFERLPRALEGLSVSVQYTPVLFAGLLKHHGQLGPAEIRPKRDWTYRQVLWLAQQHGIAMRLPAAHPFNPLALLRLAVACGAGTAQGTPNRYECETIFRHVWQGGEAADEAQRLDTLVAQLDRGRGLAALMQTDAVKETLKKNTTEAIAAGVFGVPAFAVDGRIFWGLDALPMLRGSLSGDAWFDGPDWSDVAALPTGVLRPK